MKKVCIVGASGKLGQYMVQHALDRGYEVVGVCRERSVGKLDGVKGRITVFPGATNDRRADRALMARATGRRSSTGGRYCHCGQALLSLGIFAVPAAVAFAGMVLGCSDGTGPGAGRAGDYMLNSVHFSDMLPQPVPAVHVVGSDTTVVERGGITLAGEDQCTLELVYRWRYGGVPGGATVTDTLAYTFEGRAPFRSQGLVEWFRLLRGGVHIAYLLRRGERTLILIDYDQAGSMDFYFHR